MKILQFVSIVATIVAIAMSLIYYFSSQQRERDFYTRLRNKAFTASKILVQIDAVNKDVMKLIDEKESSILVNKNVTMYDYLNNEIYNYDPDHRVKVDKDLLNKIRLEKEVRFLYKNYQVVGILYVDKFERLVTIASAIDELWYEKLADLKLTLISVFFSSVILVTFAGWFFAGRALAPISGVIREVDKISPANLSARVNEGNSMDEIASLASTFNKMLDRMEFAFRVQRMFVANASHELRTPLTSVMGQLEVSLLKPRTQEEYQKALTSVLEDIKALAGLSNKLLLLTRVSMNYEGTDFDDIRIDDLLWQSREELVKANPAYNITIDFKVGHFDEQLLMRTCPVA
jgi:signal transduction histidine kinase